MKMEDRKRGGIRFNNLRIVSSLRNPAYRLYFFGMLGQFASMNMQQVTGSLLLYRLTGSAALLGTMSLANAIPMIFLSLVGGAIADRVQKKRVLVTGLIGASLVSFGVAIALTTGHLSQENTGSWWILMVSSFLQGVVMGLTMPARQAIIPEIVSRAQVMNAVALNTLGMNVLSLVAPAVAGFLIDTFDFAAIYYAMTGLNLYAAGFILFVPPTSRITIHEGNILADIQAGFRYIKRERAILLILAFTLFFVVFSMPYRQLLPIFVDDILKVGATGMGVLLSVSGAGAMAGSLVLASSPSKKRGVLLLVSGLLSGLSLIAFSFSTSWGVSLAFMALVGLSQTGRVTISNALLQSYVEEGYMGRVMSIFMMQWGFVSMGTFLAGLMAEAIGVQWVVGGFALALFILSILALACAPRIRTLE
jgi:MFS family permease